MRKPLGTDYRGRRYWAFGANAGAWRVYVELGLDIGEDDTLNRKPSWGWWVGRRLVTSGCLPCLPIYGVGQAG